MQRADHRKVTGISRLVCDKKLPGIEKAPTGEVSDMLTFLFPASNIFKGS